VSSKTTPQISIIDLPKQYHLLRAEIRQAIDEVLEGQLFILGPAVRRFEEQFASILQCRTAVGVASGSDALLLALMALEIGPGDGVIVTPFTFFSTVSSITRLGATPLFVDIDPRTFLITPRAVAAFIEERCVFNGEYLTECVTGARIKTILPVHLFGACCRMHDFTLLARRYGLSVVEDVAQACGAALTVDGATNYAGTFGQIGCFSFFPSKNLGGYGDGGAVATNQPELDSRVRMLRMHGESSKYHHDLAGINSRLDSIQAAILSVKLRYLINWCEQRIQRAEAYRGLLAASGLIGDRILAIPQVPLDHSHVFNNYVIRARSRDELKHHLADNNIQSEVYYPLPLHLQKCFEGLGYKQGDFPHAELAANQVLALPIYPELTADQQERVVANITRFFSG
jgi:dTDP-4-amino-4,6-dideoxygalactose transaminase